MAEYHVGCGAFGIYAGTVSKDGKMWRNRTDVTDEATSAVAQYLLQEDVVMNFNYKGKSYCLKVEECEDD